MTLLGGGGIRDSKKEEDRTAKTHSCHPEEAKPFAQRRAPTKDLCIPDGGALRAQYLGPSLASARLRRAEDCAQDDNCLGTNALPQPGLRHFMSTRAEKTELHHQGHNAGYYERNRPHQVEVEPGLAENREANLRIDHPRDKSSDSKVGGGMNPGSKQRRERAGSS